MFYSTHGNPLHCIEVFRTIYKKEPVDIAFCPYRICPIGAHSDHNLGKITGFAIDKGIHIAYKPKQNGVIEKASLQFDLTNGHSSILGMEEKPSQSKSHWCCPPF